MPIIRGRSSRVGGAVVRVRLHWSRKRLRARHAAGLAAPPPVELDALLDTGAQVTCVDPALVTRVGLPIAGGGLVNMPAAGGLNVYRDYAASVAVLHPGGGRADELVIHDLPVTATPLTAFGFQMLIGRDILARCRLVYNGPARRFSLGY
jgi:hypothetical protein